MKGWRNMSKYLELLKHFLNNMDNIRTVNSQLLLKQMICFLMLSVLPTRNYPPQRFQNFSYRHSMEPNKFKFSPKQDSRYNNNKTIQQVPSDYNNKKIRIKQLELNEQEKPGEIRRNSKYKPKSALQEQSVHLITSLNKTGGNKYELSTNRQELITTDTMMQGRQLIQQEQEEKMQIDETPNLQSRGQKRTIEDPDLTESHRNNDKNNVNNNKEMDIEEVDEVMTERGSPEPMVMKWAEMLTALEIAREFKTKLPEISDLIYAVKGQDVSRIDFTKLIENNRQDPRITDTVARLKFDQWAFNKDMEHQVQPGEYNVISHFINVLRMEIHASIHDSYQTEETKVLHDIYKRGYREPITLMIQETYTNKRNEELDKANTILGTVYSATHAMETNWMGSLTDAIIHLEQQIQQVDPGRFKDISLDISETDTYEWTTAKPVRTKAPVPTAGNKFNTPNAKGHKAIAFNTYQGVPAAEQITGRHMQQAIRHSEATIKDTIHSNIVDERTLSDQVYHWTSYLHVIGLRPNRSSAETMTEVQKVLDLLGAPEDDSPEDYHSGIFLDTDFAKMLHGTNNWQSNRHAGMKDTATGFYVKTVGRHLYGTFYAHSACSGTIFPAISKVRVREKVYYLQCIPEPINIEKLQSPAKFPPLCVLRGIPTNKDKHALTATALFTVERELDYNFPTGSYAINPVQLYHRVGIDKYKHNAWVSPDTSNESDHRITSMPEIVWEIIFLGTEAGIQEGNKSPRYTKAQANMFYQVKSKMTDQPHVIKLQGFTFEVLNNIQGCHAHPQRSPTYTASNCTMIYHIPEAALARDILMTLSLTTDNVHAINEMANVTVLPPVLRARTPVPWRLLILWESTPEEIDLSPLIQISKKANLKVAVIPGYETVFMLQAIYESRRVSHEATKIHTEGQQIEHDSKDGSSTSTSTTTTTAESNKNSATDSSNMISKHLHPQIGTLYNGVSTSVRTMNNPMLRTGRGGRGDITRTVTTMSQSKGSPTELATRPTYSNAVTANDKTTIVPHDMNIGTYIHEQIQQALDKQQIQTTIQMNQLKVSILETVDGKIEKVQNAQQSTAKMMLWQMIDALHQGARQLATSLRQLNQDRRKLANVQGPDYQVLQEDIHQVTLELQGERERLKKMRAQIIEDARHYDIDTHDLPDF